MPALSPLMGAEMKQDTSKTCGKFCPDYCPGGVGERRCSLGFFDESKPQARPKTGEDYVVVRPDKCRRNFNNRYQ